jgi:glycosyltransferase involved in cell wall biosynthesis
MKLAIVLWNGDIGGAEMLTATLAAAWRELGVDAEVVFVMYADPLGSRLERLGVPYRALGFAKGAHAALRPRRFARAVAAAGPDGALVADGAHMTAFLRLGGYRAPLVGVEHGGLLAHGDLPWRKRIAHSVGRIAGAKARDVDVAVSDFMLGNLRKHPHARRTTRIHNFVDPGTYRVGAAREASGELIVGCAGRLIPGKGVDHLLRAVAEARRQHPVRLRIAGDGPERGTLESLAAELDLGGAAEFCGFLDDISGFWSSCDLAATPSDAFIDTFCLVALEAMACGKPVVATVNGGIPEVVADGVCGELVPPGDVHALAAAIAGYAADREKLRRHGAAARRRAESDFDPATLAGDYLELFAPATAGSR